MRNTGLIFKRELRNYFATPVAYVFIAVFLALSGALTFYAGDFLARGRADLQPFFAYHPWLYLLLIPAISMRLWAEERHSGTIELLMTLPVSVAEAVIGKFLAAWAFVALSVGLTFPIWITVNLLGDPDNGAIVTGYLGSLIMAGAFLAIGACLSALTRSQVVAFLLTAVACFLFTVSGTEIVLGLLRGWAPGPLVEAVAGLSFLVHFEAVRQGVIDLRDLVFHVSMIAFWLFATVVAVDLRKAD